MGDRQQWQFPKNEANKVLGWRSNGKGLENKDYVSPGDLAGKQDADSNLDTLSSGTTTLGATGLALLEAETEDDALAELPSVVRNADATDAVNTAKVIISETDLNFQTDPWFAGTTSPEGLTTPRRAEMFVGGVFDEDGGGGVNYLWNIMGYQVNSGTAPITPVMARARGHVVYPLSSSGRAYGVNPQLHGLEITVGLFESEATGDLTDTSDTITNITITEPGSRFEAGMEISGTGIPGGTTILSVVGRPGAPTSITMSANATATGSGVTIKAQPSGTLESVGILVTGNGGTTGAGNPAGIAMQVQAYNDESRFYRGLQFGSSALLPTGTGIRFTVVTADRGMSFESCTLSGAALNFSSGSFANILSVSNATLSGAALSFSGVTGTSGLNFVSSNSFSTAAIVLSGQDIATDTTTGMKIATSSTQKIGFYGKTPIARPGAIASASGGSTVDAEARTAINAVLAQLRAWGLIAI